MKSFKSKRPSKSNRKTLRQLNLKRLGLETLEDRVVPVSNLMLDGNNALISFDVNRDGPTQTYTPGDLIGVDLVAFSATSDAVLLVGDGAGVPAAGTRADLLEDNFFDTGVINPGAGNMTVRVDFLSPVTNGPGPDIVLFEIDQDSADVINVHINGTTLNTTVGGPDLTGPVPADVLRSSNPINSLADLENDPFGGTQSDAAQMVRGLEIDLSEFGIAAGDSILFMEFGSGEVDPVFIAGLPSVSANPDPELVVEPDYATDEDTALQVPHYSDIVSADGPLVYWQLNEADKSAGQTAVNDGTLGAAGDGTYLNVVGNVLNPRIQPGEAASFGTTAASGSTGDRVQLATTSLPTTAITAEAWVRGTPGANNDPTIFSIESSTANQFLLIEQGDDWRIFVNGAAMSFTNTAQSDIIDGEWHHVALTWDSGSGTANLYVDGTLLDTTTVAQGASMNPTATFVIAQEQDSQGGGFQDNQKFVGDLDEVALYDRELSAAEILEHFNAASLSILSNDVGNTISIISSDSTSAQGASVTVNPDGSFSYDPTGSATTQALNQGQVVTDTFNYTITDSDMAPDGLITVVGIDINNANGATDSQVSNLTEAENIYAAAVNAGFDFSAGQTGTINIGGTIYNINSSGQELDAQTDWGGAGRNFSPTNNFPGITSGDDFLIHAHWSMLIPAGTYTIYGQSDDGYSLKLNGITFTSKFGAGAGQGAANELRFEGTTGNSNTGGTFTVASNTIVEAETIFFERGGGEYFELAIVDQATTDTSPPDPYAIIENGAFGIVVSTTSGPLTVPQDSASVSVELTGVNDPPTAGNISLTISESGSINNQQFQGDDPDAEDNQGTLMYTITGGPTPNMGLLTNNFDGTFSFNTNGDFEGLSAATVEQVTFTYSATDMRTATSNTATVTITVIGENDLPTANDDPDTIPGFYQVDEGGPALSIDAADGLLANDTDIDDMDLLGLKSIDTSGTNGIVTADSTNGVLGGLSGDYIDLNFASGLDGNETGAGPHLFLPLAGPGDFVAQRLVGLTPTGDAANVVTPCIDFGGGTDVTGSPCNLTEGNRGNFDSGSVPLWQGLFNDAGVTADMDGDQILAIWTGDLQITTGGTYTFETRSDDGSVVFINGQRVVNNNNIQGGTNRSGTIDLLPGSHTISIGYYEGGSNAIMQAFYSGPDTGGVRHLLTGAVVSHNGGTPGFLGNYYDLNNGGTNGLVNPFTGGNIGFNADEWLLFPSDASDNIVMQALTPQFDDVFTPRVDFGGGTENIPGDGSNPNRGTTNGNMFGGLGLNMDTDQVGGVWTGYLLVPENAEFQFALRSDDNSQMWLDLNDDGFFDSSEIVVSRPCCGITTGPAITLPAGPIGIMIAGDEAGGGAAIVASWQQNTGSSFGLTVIQPQFLTPNLVGDGSFTYDPNGLFESLGVGESDIDTFTYAVQDPSGEMSMATVTITINGENDDPVPAHDGPYSIEAGEDLMVDASATTDVDTNDVLSYQWDVDNDGNADFITPNAIDTIPWNVFANAGLQPGTVGNPIVLRVNDGTTTVAAPATTLDISSTFVFNAQSPILDYTLIRNGNILEIFDSAAGTILSSVSLTGLTDIDVNGDAIGADTFRVDFSGGNPIPGGGVNYDGGDPTSPPGDELILQNGSFGSTTYDFFSENSGQIDLDGSTITYTGLEPISSNINAADVTLNYSGSSETVTVTDPGGNQTMVDSTVGEMVTFNNPTNSLTINSGVSNAAPINLSIDINDRGAAGAGSTQAGFQEFLIGGTEDNDINTPTTRSFGGVDITVSHSNGGDYGDRRRGQPVAAGAFTDEQLLRDFTFFRGTTPNDGANILLEGLVPGAVYDVRLWSFDDSSGGNRVSDWFANGVMVLDDYTFDGNAVPPSPPDNDTYAFSFPATANGSGEILIEGRYVSGTCCSVFLDGLSLSQVNDGDDVINIDGLAANYGADVIINSNEGSDVVNFNTSVDLGNNSLEVNSPTINLNSTGVDTGTDDQTYNGATVLGANNTLTGNDVTFNGTVNSDGTPWSLDVNADGVTAFNRSIGSISPLSSLTTDPAGSTEIGLGGTSATGGADFFADATQDTDGDNRWEDLVPGNPSGFDLLPDNSPAVNRVQVVSSLAGIEAAYDMPGGSTGNNAGALLTIAGTSTQRSFQEAPGDWSNEDVTIEIWFKPDDLTPTPTNGQILFEDGGGTGFGFFVDNNELRLRKAPGNGNVGFDISGIAGEFIQAVGTYDVSAGVMELFINGVSVGTDNPGGNDWSGGDAAGVGTRGDDNVGGIGGGQQDTESFDGQVAIFRVYRNQILTPGQVAANFDSVSNSVSLVNITTTGNQNFGDDVTVGVQTTLNGTNITFSDTLDSNGNNAGVEVNSTGGGTTTFDGAVGSINPLLDLTTNADGTTEINGGEVTTTADQTYNDPVNITNANTLLDTGGDTNFEGAPVVVTGNLTIDSGDDIDFEPGATLTVSGNVMMDAVDNIRLDDDVDIGGTTDIDAADNVEFGGNLIIGDDAVITAGDDAIFSGSINSAAGENNSLTANVVDVTTFDGPIGNNDALSSLITDASGSTQIGGGIINTNGASATFNDAVILTADLIMTETGPGDTTFNSSVDGGFNLTVNTSGGGDTVFGSDVGVNTPLASLTTDAFGQTLFLPVTTGFTPGLDFHVDAKQDTDGDNRWEDLAPGNPSGFDFELDNSPAVNRVTGVSSFPGIDAAYDFPGGSINSEAGAELSLSGAGGKVSFQNAPDDWSDEDVTIEIWFKPDDLTPSPTNGQILFEDGGGTGFGFFVDNNELRLRKAGGGGNVGFDISGISGEFIQAVGTFDVSAGVMELFINGVSVGTDNPGGNDWSGGDNAAVGTRGQDNTGGIGSGQQNTESFDGQVAIFRVYRNQILTPTQVAANFDAVTKYQVITTGDQTYNDSVVLGTDVIMTGNTISFNDDANGDGVGSAESLEIAGDLVQGDGPGDYIGNADPLDSLTVSGTTTFNAVFVAMPNVQTLNDQTYNGDVILNQNTTLTSLSGGDVDFVSQIDGDWDLSVNTDGATIFRGAVGSNTRLATITTDVGGETDINGSQMLTTGDQTYNDPVVLTADAVVDSNSSGDITFESTVNSDTVDNWSLTVNTDGTTTFNDDVGLIEALDSLTTDAGGTTIINGDVMTVGGTQTYNDPATIGSDITLTDTGSSGITFGQTVDGTTDFQELLTVTITDPAAQILFTGDVGSTIPLESLVLNSPGQATLQGNLQDNVGEGAGGTTLVKNDGGTLSFLGNDNNYSGMTTINGGNVDLQGVLTDSADNFVLNANVTLAGGGQVLDRTVEVPAGITAQINGLSKITNLGGTAVDVAGIANLTDNTINDSDIGVAVSGTANINNSSNNATPIANNTTGISVATTGTANLVDTLVDENTTGIFVDGVAGGAFGTADLTTSVIRNNDNGIETFNANLVLNRTGGGNQIINDVNSLNGLLLRGEDAQLSDGIQANHLGNTIFEVPALPGGPAGGGNFIQLAENSFFGFGEPELVDASDATFNGIVGSTLMGTTRDQVENRVVHFLDVDTVGLILYRTNVAFVDDGELVVYGGNGENRVTINAFDPAMVTVRFGASTQRDETTDERFFDLTQGPNPPSITVFSFGGDDDIRITANIFARVFAGDGDDEVRTGDGDDFISGGTGRDRLRSGKGNDIIVGGLGRDIIYAEDGDDLIVAGATPLGPDELLAFANAPDADAALEAIAMTVIDPDDRDNADRIESGRGRDRISLRLSGRGDRSDFDGADDTQKDSPM